MGAFHDWTCSRTRSRIPFSFSNTASSYSCPTCLSSLNRYLQANGICRRATRSSLDSLSMLPVPECCTTFRTHSEKHPHQKQSRTSAEKTVSRLSGLVSGLVVRRKTTLSKPVFSSLHSRQFDRTTTCAPP
ncbi:hypothetical protein BU23DRAFT_40067 [Bimuria novae-zelandiae CBS 107.79]|uniref:Uncharacterized protein n=1 Tax=Bimuria novae-zelandiae CBS 107.79 TaxID=1447943 RepID=A0A6A5UID0_9PLEO|nr:hypothetical protein BU23DRAFT_40067 [Bimuria novae-zelandiae CBS 107.79]